MLISEIFGPTIQGEGVFIGKPTIFVRTAGCDYRCSWCDTMYSVDPIHRDEWTVMTSHEVMQEIWKIAPRPMLVTLSGGNPALAKLDGLVELGHDYGFTFTMETQGTVARAWMKKLDFLTLSPKPPSSGMQTDLTKLDICAHLIENTCLKVVCFDDRDFDYAKSIAARYPFLPFYLQPGNETVGQPFDIASVLSKFSWLVQKTISCDWMNVTVLPQLHLFLWGNERAH